MTSATIIKKYISFFESKKHQRIANAPLVPLNDPTTLFTSSGMQPLVPYLLGETHPQGTRLVDVQNCFRAVDIDEVGDNRHTTFFRMLGNWSLGDYFKKEQLPWIYNFLTHELGFDPKRLYVTIFQGSDTVPKDNESAMIWESLFREKGLNPKERIFSYGAEKNWWSRSGIPEKMPAGEPGGPDSEIFYDFGAELKLHEKSPYKDSPCHVNCDCGRFIEICNSVFMQYRKNSDGSLTLLPKPNVDFGGGLERLLLALENQPDVFQTSLFAPIIASLTEQTDQPYEGNERAMRIVADHLIAASFITLAGIKPSNKEQGYILRRLIRRAIDHLYTLKEIALTPILEIIASQYHETDHAITEQFETIKFVILEEEQKYAHTRNEAKKYIEKKYQGKQTGDELLGKKEITPDDAFILYSTHGLSPTQIKSLGYEFDEQTFAEKMKAHQDLSRLGSKQKFAGGLADHQELTIKGHTATHLLQQALRDIFGNNVHQTGSNITTQRLRFDFNYTQKITDEEIKQLEVIVREKIAANLPVHFEMLPLQKAKEIGAIGLFDEKYSDKVKVYFIGNYSKEFCGGPHVARTSEIKSFKITKQENIGHGQRRLYAVVS